jgi:hypothetical protein
VRRTLVVALIGAVALAAGTMLGFSLDSDDSDAPVATAGLPAAVEETRSKLEAAAEAGDYDAVAELVPAGFRYTFGDTVEGGPVAHWQNLERTSDQRPLETLAAILKLPYVLSRGYYVWP